MQRRLINVIHQRHAKTNEPKPVIGISGKWLEEIGFKQNSLITVEGSSKTLTVKAFDSNLGLSELKGISGMDKKLAFFQVRQLTKSKNVVVPALYIKGKVLENLGFTVGCLVAAYYEYGVIHMHVLDDEDLKTRDLSPT